MDALLAKCVQVCVLAASGYVSGTREMPRLRVGQQHHLSLSAQRLRPMRAACILPTHRAKLSTTSLATYIYLDGNGC